MNSSLFEMADLEILPAARGVLLSSLGVRDVADFRGMLPIGADAAEVRIEPDDRLQVFLPQAGPIDPLQILAAHAHLPGNFRRVGGRRGGWLAELPLQAGAALVECLAEVAAGLRAVAAGEVASRVDALGIGLGADRQADAQAVRVAIGNIDWGDEQIVDRGQTRCEVRPRIHGSAVSVQIDFGAEGVRVFRMLLDKMPAEVAGSAVARHLLCVGQRLRYCRAVARDGGIAIETRLPGALLEPRGLALAATAVAVAARGQQETISLLARDARIAQWCATLLDPSRGAGEE